MRYIALLLLPVCLYAVDCKKPESRVESAICNVPELHALDRQIEKESAAMKAKLTGENAAILSDSEMPYLRLRNDCADHADPPGCLRNVLTQRVDLLTRAQADPNAIRQAIGQAYFIDIGFLRKYWLQLVDRKVSVYGCLMPDDTEKTHAMLETENQAPVLLVFGSMRDEILEFLRDQKPCSYWLVTVRKLRDKFILYADDVLGQPLP
jgi:uncharacterized protein